MKNCGKFRRSILKAWAAPGFTPLTDIRACKAPVQPFCQRPPSVSFPPGASRTRAAITAVLDAQSAAWNRGDIDGYMDGYARLDSIVFVSGDSVTHGWQTVRNRYVKRYDSREKMGTLTFSDLEFRPIDNNTVAVVGRWHLKRTSDEPHGRFTLIFKRTRQGWRIIHDHTSSAE